MKQKNVVTLYRETWNLGDAVQTLALSRLIDVHAGIFRGEKIYLANDYLHVNNGYISEKDFIPHHDALFAGVHIDVSSGDDNILVWLENSSRPIGSRDPWTHEYLLKKGINSELVGCATVTFPTIGMCGKDVINVESSLELDGCIKMDHLIHREMSWGMQWNRAQSYVTRYSMAKFVATCRLHVALVCIAYGIPFFVDRPRNESMERRFSILSEMGVRFGEINQISNEVVDEWRLRYKGFLERFVDVEEHSPGFVKPIWDVV